jgi:hypothetical protein
MPFKKNEIPEGAKPFKKGQSGNPKGRPKKMVSKILDQLREQGEQVTRNMITNIYQVFLSLPQKKLSDISKNKTYPMMYRILAGEMLGDRAFDIMEKMIDRANGKALVMQEINQSIDQKNTFDLSNLTDEQLEQLATLTAVIQPDTSGEGEEEVH